LIFITYHLTTADPNGDESDFDILKDYAALTCVLEFDNELMNGVSLTFDDIKDKVEELQG